MDSLEIYFKEDVMSEQLAERIKETMSRYCPAFFYKPVSSAIWHGCLCLASTKDDTSCECVWHQRDYCIAGTWKQLDFVNEQHKRDSKNALRYLRKAEIALEVLGGNSNDGEQ